MKTGKFFDKIIDVNTKDKITVDIFYKDKIQDLACASLIKSYLESKAHKVKVNLIPIGKNKLNSIMLSRTLYHVMVDLSLANYIEQDVNNINYYISPYIKLNDNVDEKPYTKVYNCGDTAVKIIENMFNMKLSAVYDKEPYKIFSLDKIDELIYNVDKDYLKVLDTNFKVSRKVHLKDLLKLMYCDKVKHIKFYSRINTAVVCFKHSNSNLFMKEPIGILTEDSFSPMYRDTFKKFPYKVGVGYGISNIEYLKHNEYFDVYLACDEKYSSTTVRVYAKSDKIAKSLQVFLKKFNLVDYNNTLDNSHVGYMISKKY